VSLAFIAFLIIDTIFVSVNEVEDEDSSLMTALFL